MQNLIEYIDIVDDVLDLTKNDELSIQKIENKKSFYLQNQDLFKKIVPDFTEGKTSCGIFVAYGYRLYAAMIGKKVELLTHQDGYIETPVFPFRVDDILDYTSEHNFTGNEETDNIVENEDNEFQKASSILLNWMINPQSNIDILPEIISKMVVPSIKRIRKSIIGSRSVINILLPPFAKEFTSSEKYEGDEESKVFDFTQIFQETDFEDMEVNFLDYSSLVDIKDNERKYLAIQHNDGKNEYLIFSVYEKIRGHKECLGSVAINTIAQKNYILQTFNQNIVIEKKESLLINDKKKDDEINFEPVENKLPIPSSFSSFLGEHTTSFIDTEYILKIGMKTGNKEVDTIISFFENTKSMSVAEICARYVNEQNLYNIALSDMVYIAILLEQHSEIFQQSTLRLSRKDRIVPVQNTEFVHYQSILLPHLPANFSRIGWKINFMRRLKIIPYQKIGYKLPLRSIIESVVKHYDDCTTDDVVEEYLFIHTKNKKQGVNEVPNAMSAAKMFVELLNIDSIAIDFYNDTVF